MTDTVLDMAWSDIQVGYFVRWATPRFVKYGHVKKVDNRSMIVSFLDSLKPTVLPDAKWYFVRGKENPEAEEHLVVIDYKQWWHGDHTEWQPIVEGHPLVAETISVNEACELLKMDPKQMRRLIRRGTIPAYKDQNDTWRVYRTNLMEISAKHGWI